MQQQRLAHVTYSLSEEDFPTDYKGTVPDDVDVDAFATTLDEDADGVVDENEVSVCLMLMPTHHANGGSGSSSTTHL